MGERKIDTPEERRQERFFQRATEDTKDAAAWYYRAREGIFGPFASRAMAEVDLAELVYRSPDKRRQHVK
ncbi:MAG TPA: hypothetical protein VLW45_05645 [Pelomicrobium sp.]|nr:hypothetical protein [Pelomicrobium sp.]